MRSQDDQHPVSSLGSYRSFFVRKPGFEQWISRTGINVQILATSAGSGGAKKRKRQLYSSQSFKAEVMGVGTQQTGMDSYQLTQGITSQLQNIFLILNPFKY